MRYGLLADVHANLSALETAIATLERAGATAWLCAGDVVGYGAEPNECVATLARLGATCVAGNHDLMALGELDARHEQEIVRASTAWTRARLSAGARAWLAALPRVATAGPVVLAHGTLEDPERYTDRPGAARDQLATAARLWPAAAVLVLGHSHRPLLWREDGTLARPPLSGGTLALGAGRALCNPGSVGQSRQRERAPRVRCALLDLDAREVTYFAVAYDHARVRRQLRSAGLAPAGVHLLPGRSGALLRRLGATARRLS